MEPRLLCRGGPDGSPADPDRGDGGLAHRAGAEPRRCADLRGERRRRLVGMAAAPVQMGFAAELALAADAFVITPVGRIADGARARAEGDEVRTVIAGYHWFTDWGRDTMISLEGLTLSAGRAIEARWILRTFAHYLRDGLIPNMFPEEKIKASTTRPTRRCGSFTRCTAMSSIVRTRRPWNSCCRS